VAPLSRIKSRARKSKIFYHTPSESELAEREAERLRALANFAAGTDWPPWEDSPGLRPQA